MKKRFLAAAAVGGIAVGALASQASASPQVQAHTTSDAQITMESKLTAIQFFTPSGALPGFPTSPLVPGDRIIGQDQLSISGDIAGHDNEVCTVSFNRDVLCNDIMVIDGRGDINATWTIQWPASGYQGPPSFSGVVTGGTDEFSELHGTFVATELPDGNIGIVING